MSRVPPGPTSAPSPGTWAAALEVGGHLTALRRTAVGDFSLAEARTLGQLAELADPVTLPLPEALARAMPVISIDAEQARIVAHGGPFPRRASSARTV